MDDFYALLNVRRGATIAEIKEQYRFLAQAYHPDKFASEDHKHIAGESFKKINEAYQMILREAQREENLSPTQDNSPSDYQHSAEQAVKQVELKGGMWFHESGGFYGVKDSEDNNTPMYALAGFIKHVASYQPDIAGWILKHYPSDGKPESLTKFWKELAVVLMVWGKWFLAWRGCIFGDDPSTESVSNAVKMCRQGVNNLHWPLEANVKIIAVDSPTGNDGVECTWGQLL